MRVAVQSRVVAAPWEPETVRRVVGREAHVEPDAGPLALYRSVFPERYVRWNTERQLFEIRQQNPDTGVDSRIELVFEYDAPPEKETGRILSAEEVADLVEKKDPSVVRVFRAFDYPFVWQRIRERHEIHTKGLPKWQRERLERNRRVKRVRYRDTARNLAARAEDSLRTYLPGRGADFSLTTG